MDRNVKSTAALSAWALVFIAPVMTGVTTTGYAQQRTPDEIIVSVRRKDESLQDVPIAVTTLGETEIQRLGINSIQDVVKYSASLEFDEGFGAQDTRVVIRGLSPTRGRSNVAFLVDGIDFTGEAVSTAGGGLLVNQQLLDVERVEIVKGPQSALYGRSAFGGAIQYITKRPSLDETEGSVNVQFGSGGRGNAGVRFGGAYGGPVTEKFGLRVNGLVYDEEGYYENTLTGQSVGGSEGYGLALAGLWEPTSTLEISGRVAGSHDEYEPQAQARPASNLLVDIDDSLAVQNGETLSLIRTSGLANAIGGQAAYPGCGPSATNADGTVTSCLGEPRTLVAGRIPDGDQLSVVQSEDPRTGNNYRGTTADTITTTLAIKWDLGPGELSSYTGYAALNSNQFFDGQNDALLAGSHGSLDGSYNFTLADCGFINCSPAVQEIGFDNETRLLSQEIRYATDFDFPVNFTVGGLYWSERVKQNEFGSTISPAIFRNAVFAPPGGTPPVENAPAGNLNIANVFQAAPGQVRRDTDSYSLYGLIDWEISSAWNLSVEARYVTEDLVVAGNTCDTIATEALTGLDSGIGVDGGPICDASFRGTSSVGVADGTGTQTAGTYSKAVYLSESAQFDGDFVAPKATLEWFMTDDHMLYVSVAKGVKPGGISTITAGSFFNASENTFDDETLWAYELGSKNVFADGNVVVNGAIFFQDYADKQVGVSRFNPDLGVDTGSIENAGEAEVKGLEVDAVWQVTDRVRLAAGYSYIDAEYTKFELETASANNIARSLAAGGQGCLTIIDNDPLPGDGQSDNCLVSLTGNDIEDVPEHSFVGNARYMAPFGDNGLEWYADAIVIYRDERFIDEFNVKSLDSYWTTDLSAGLVADQWEMILFVQNAFDDDTVKSGVDFGSQVNTVRQGYFPPGPTDGVIVSLPDPRVIGLRANYRF